MIFHALPLNPIDAWETFQTLSIADQVINVMPPMAGQPNDWRYNLDGFVVHTVRSDLSRQTYSQCFRDGGIEAVSPLDHDPQKGGFHGLVVEIPVINALTNYQKLWQLLGVSGHMLMALTLSGVRGAKILTGIDTVGPGHDETFGHDIVLIPELVVQDPSEPAARLLKPLFDLMWNGGGCPKSPWYDGNGERIQRR